MSFSQNKRNPTSKINQELGGGYWGIYGGGLGYIWGGMGGINQLIIKWPIKWPIT